MRKRKRTVEQVVVSGYAAEGKSLAKVNGKVAFIEGAVPGDVVDLLITRDKKEWAEGRAIKFHKFSSERVTPFCTHFGLCGGCKWQMLPYEKQLEYKQKEVEENLKRIGKVNSLGYERLSVRHKRSFIVINLSIHSATKDI